MSGRTAAPAHLLEGLWSRNRAEQTRAWKGMMEATEAPVPWAYDVWDALTAHLAPDEDEHARSVSAQVLCNLAKSDPEERILRELPAILQVNRDARSVAARHVLGEIWKIGAAGPRQCSRLLSALTERFVESERERKVHFVRIDTIAALRRLHDAVEGDQRADVERTALGLIDSERDVERREKLAADWAPPKKAARKKGAR